MPGATITGHWYCGRRDTPSNPEGMFGNYELFRKGTYYELVRNQSMLQLFHSVWLTYYAIGGFQFSSHGGQLYKRISLESCLNLII